MFFKCRYETGNGIFAEERGVVLNKGTKNQANSVIGSYKYVSPEGIPVELTYTAGVDGFKAYGTHLPVVPAAASNVPKNLALKNVVTSAFARPAQLRTADAIPQSTRAAADVVPSGQLDVGQSRTTEVPEPRLQVTDAAPEVILLSGDKQEERPAPASNELEQQSPVQQNSFVSSPELYYYQHQLQQQQPAAPVTQTPPSPSPPQQQDQPSAVVFPQQNAPAPQRPLLPTLKQFEPLKPAVATVIRTMPQTLGQAQVLSNGQRPEWQRTVVPAGYHQLRYANARPNPYPAFAQHQQRPGPVRQFSVEPQQMWYVQSQGWPQQGQYFQSPSPVLRSMQPPKY